MLLLNAFEHSAILSAILFAVLYFIYTTSIEIMLLSYHSLVSCHQFLFTIFHNSIEMDERCESDIIIEYYQSYIALCKTFIKLLLD